MNIKELPSNTRFYCLLFSFCLSIFFYFVTQDPKTIFTLVQIYALTAVIFLYFALLAGPLTYTFKFLPFRGQYLKIRRAIGVSAFYFATLHAFFALTKNLGGISGLLRLDSTYLIAITFSLSALIILSLMAATSFDSMVEKLTFPRWKALHRLVYFAGIFIIIHALLIGPHFYGLNSPIASIFFFAISFLLLLESLRFDWMIKQKFSSYPKIGIVFLTTLIVLILIYFNYFLLK